MLPTQKTSLGWHPIHDVFVTVQKSRSFVDSLPASGATQFRMARVVPTIFAIHSTISSNGEKHDDQAERDINIAETKLLITQA